MRATWRQSAVSHDEIAAFIVWPGICGGAKDCNGIFFIKTLFPRTGTASLLDVLQIPSAAMRISARLFFPLALFVAVPAFAQTAAVRPSGRVQLFHLGEVKLLPGPFAHAQELARAYLLKHDVDRLVAPFRAEAGLPVMAAKYPNWESTGLDGHTAGHYLTALAQMVAATGDAELGRRLAYMVDELAACQRAHGNGYVGPIPDGKTFWADVAAGRIRADNFSVNSRWVPWYNLHKLYAGLRDAWLIAGHAPAREVLIGLADWCDRLVAGLSDEQLQAMLKAEHGGMNEVLADVSAITGDPKYLALARRFSHRVILDPLLVREDRLDGLHANTQIPKVIGFARIGELGGEPSLVRAAEFFWETVTARRSVAFGGNSVREHFNRAGDFSSMAESREGPETCNTYNLLRLSEALFSEEPQARYADYYERALFNHILSAQHPEHGGFVYFTPIRPRHYRVYSQPEKCFWCCVGSGMESHGRHARFIYAHSDDTLWVNLFVSSVLNWRKRGLLVRQETRFPDDARTTLTFSGEAAQPLKLALRHPAWVAPGALAIRVNGEAWPASSQPSSYVFIERVWRAGDRVEIELPMRTTTESLPDGSGYVAVLHGPVVLAAKTGTDRLDGLLAGDSRMGHIAPGPYLPLDQAPMLVGDPATLAQAIEPVAGKPLTFTARKLVQPAACRELELVPFFRVHDARYMLYWRTATPEGYAELVKTLEAREAARLALEARTLDQVAPGEQQPEVEHQLRSEDSNTGVHLGRSWRDAKQWFSYELKTVAGVPTELIVTYSGGERGRNFEILVNDQPVATVSLRGSKPDEFVDETYAISPAAAGTGQTLTVKFVAKEGSRVAPIYGIRLVRRVE
jgi:uncharacterized protein